jgi:hypothetical protein
MEFFEKLKSVILHPKIFFQKVSSEGVEEGFKYMLFLTLITLPLYILYGYIRLKKITLLPLFIGLYALTIIIILIASFVFAAFLHPFVILFGGKQGYAKTYNAAAYSATLSVLTGWAISLAGLWLPPVESIFSVALYVYTLCIQTLGISVLQKMSKARAFLSIISLAVLIVLISAVLFLTMGTMWRIGLS